MGGLWITYAWEDNRDRDVDFISQELMAAGIQVRLDRWTIGAGRRLWDQIAAFISDPAQSDAWLIYATQKSLASQACREELAYALDRALKNRGEEFPVIALFPSRVDEQLIPASIRIRLHVSTADPDWKERIIAAVERRPPCVGIPAVQPYVMRSHPAPAPFEYVLEFRPRAGTWNPFVFAVPVREKDQVGLALRSGPPDRVPAVAGAFFEGAEGVSDDGQWWYKLGWGEASPTTSYYAFLREMPSRLAFGQEGERGKAIILEGPRVNRTGPVND